MMTPPYGSKQYRINDIVQSGAISSAMVNAAIIDDQGNAVDQQYAVRK